MSKFLETGLVPKEETGAQDFLASHPEYNGRNVVVGILDTGVDPGAIGLQTTPHGDPKVINIVDCTGSGDVDTCEVVEGKMEDEEKVIVGLSGRKLILNESWENPTNKWHIGIKRAYELYPDNLKSRVIKERRKGWDKAQEELEVRLAREKNESKESEVKKEREEGIKMVRKYSSEYEDPGPIMDCVVFHDGEGWLTVVDTEERGDLRDYTPMQEFHIAREFRPLTDLDALNFGINIFEEGNKLSIVVDAGSHGTHVASIVGAYHEDNPSLNGIAPGCQIVSLKIGDSRLGSMETGVGLIRACIEAVKNKCDILNISYGEAAALFNQGRFMETATELVRKHGIMIVSSAGNNGPALTTVGAPGGTGTAIMSIAAAFSKNMMESSYSIYKPENVEDMNFNWSSMGPCFDGGLGVSIIAPGGAVTSVPNWNLKKLQLMNGTSMSSPNACGCISLLLSALKTQSIPYLPIRVRRAVERSARMMESVDVLGQGHGMIHIPSAYDLLMDEVEDPHQDVEYEVTIRDHEKCLRGVYIRDALPSDCSEFKARISPLFHEDSGNESKIEFEKRFVLRAEHPEWVTVGSSFILANEPRDFTFSIDHARACEKGGKITSFIRGFEVGKEENGWLFEVPIVVVRPKKVGVNGYSNDIMLNPGVRHREFITPERGATWCDVIYRDLRTIEDYGCQEENGEENEENKDGDSRCDARQLLVFHALQLFEHTPYRDNEKDVYLWMRPGSEKVLSFPLRDDQATIEFVFSRYWSSLLSTPYSFQIKFRGVVPSSCSPTSPLSLIGGRSFTPLSLTSHLDSELVAPDGKLTVRMSPLSPTSHTIQPMNGERDTLPNGKQIYQLILQYELKQPEKDVEITPRWHPINGLLYESPFEAQFYMIFDENKRLVGTGDAWPKKAKISPKGGKHTIRLSIRHDNPTLLEGLVSMVCNVETKLEKPIALKFVSTQRDVSCNGPKMPSRFVHPLQSISCFVVEPTIPPKVLSTPHDSLSGSFTIVKKVETGYGMGCRPNGFEVVLTPTISSFPPQKSKPQQQQGGGKELSYEEGMKKWKISALKKRVGKDEFQEVFDTLMAEYDSDLEVLQSRISHLHTQFIAGVKGEGDIGEFLGFVGEVVELVREDEIILRDGKKREDTTISFNQPSSSEGGEEEEKESKKGEEEEKKKKEKKEEEDKESADHKLRRMVLIDVLKKKLEVLVKLSSSSSAVALEHLQSSYRHLTSWVDMDKRVGEFGVTKVKILRLANKPFEALSKIKEFEASSSFPTIKKQLEKEEQELLGEFGWDHIMENRRQWSILNHPKDFAPF